MNWKGGIYRQTSGLLPGSLKCGRCYCDRHPHRQSLGCCTFTQTGGLITTCSVHRSAGLPSLTHLTATSMSSCASETLRTVLFDCFTPSVLFASGAASPDGLTNVVEIRAISLSWGVLEWPRGCFEPAAPQRLFLQVSCPTPSSLLLAILNVSSVALK